jgi:hypothetical protein
LFNLLTDPKEEYPQGTIQNTWALTPLLKQVADFAHSTGFSGDVLSLSRWS